MGSVMWHSAAVQFYRTALLRLVGGRDHWDSFPTCIQMYNITISGVTRGVRRTQDAQLVMNNFGMAASDEHLIRNN